MKPELIEQMRKEEASLLEKLTAVRAILKAYDPSYDGEDDSTSRKGAGRNSEYATQVRDIARELILDGGNEPLQISEIYKAVTDKGVVVRGQKPQSALSALLSRHPHFESIPEGGGWKLTEEGAKDEADAKADTESKPPVIQATPAAIPAQNPVPTSASGVPTPPAQNVAPVAPPVVAQPSATVAAVASVPASAPAPVNPPSQPAS